MPFTLSPSGYGSFFGCRAGLIALGIGTLTLCMAALLYLFHLLRKAEEARKKAEAAAINERKLLTSMMDASPNHISIKDKEGRYILLNRAVREYLHLNDPEKAKGRTSADFFKEAEQFFAEDRQVLETGEAIVAKKEPVITHDGRMNWFATTKVPLRDSEGAICGLISIHCDITDWIAAEERLRVIGTQLEQSNRELRDFAGVASHDLQEPLRKIQAFSDRLRVRHSGVLSPEALIDLERVQSAATRMQTLIQDLLLLSRISSRELRIETVDLGRIITEVQTDLAIRIAETGATIEVGKLPTLDADPSQMRLLFQNLLSNALKFHKPGQQPEVTVQGKVLQVQDYQLPGAGPGDEVAQIRVTDNGIGFGEEYVGQIFTLFARLHGREEYEGTGIGLAVCRKIAQRHGGSIVAKSEKGQGATFTLMLPVKQKTHPQDKGEGES